MFVEEVCGIRHIEYVISSDANFHLQRISCNDYRDGMVGSDRTIPASLDM